MTKHLAGNMLTNAEGENNSLRKMWIRSVHGEFCLCLSIGDIMVMLSAVSVLMITLVKKLSKYNCADVYTLFLSILSSPIIYLNLWNSYCQEANSYSPS